MFSRSKIKLKSHKEHFKKSIFNTQSIGFPDRSEQAEGFSNEILIVASPMTVTTFRQCK